MRASPFRAEAVCELKRLVSHEHNVADEVDYQEGMRLKRLCAQRQQMLAILAVVKRIEHQYERRQRVEAANAKERARASAALGEAQSTPAPRSVRGPTGTLMHPVH